MTVGTITARQTQGGYMKLPHKIRIKSKVAYEVVWAERIGDDETTLGECRYDTKQIVLKTGMSDTEVMKTLIHEVFHAMAFEYDIQIPHKAIYHLEHSVYKVIKLNKWGIK